jgi:hypothetical protein
MHRGIKLTAAAALCALAAVSPASAQIASSPPPPESDARLVLRRHALCLAADARPTYKPTHRVVAPRAPRSMPASATTSRISTSG